MAYGSSSNSKRKEPPPSSDTGGGGSSGTRNPKRSGSFGVGRVPAAARNTVEDGATIRPDEDGATATATATATPAAHDRPRRSLGGDDGGEEDTTTAAAAVVDPVECPDCGHDVPRMNLAVHGAVCRRTTTRRSGGRVREEGEEARVGNREDSREEGWEVVYAANADADRVDRVDGGGGGVAAAVGNAAAVVPSAPPYPYAPPDAAAAAASTMARPTSPVRPSAPPYDQSALSISSQWPCPRCTLLNSDATRYCDACHLIRPGVVGRARGPDGPDRAAGRGGQDGGSSGGRGERVPRRRAGVDWDHFNSPPPRLSEAMGAAYRPDLLSRQHQRAADFPSIADSDAPAQSQQQGGAQSQRQQRQGGQFRYRTNRPAALAVAQTANSIVSGAVIGSVLGGAVGALVGATVGGVMDGMTRWNNRAAAAAANSGGSAAAASGGGSRGGVTYSATTIPGTGMRVITMRADGFGGGGPVEYDNFEPTSNVDRVILQMLLASASSQGATNPDQMSYEELLSRFGAGTENQRRGAAPELIDSIPLIRIGDGGSGSEEGHLDVTELRENERTCGVCLEDFGAGDEVRRLTCRHAFHRECGDRWFRQVASCPICKREIEDCRSSSSSGTGVKDEGVQEAL